ncbi:hypothetical protein GAYE_SCF00G1636 [Galdieria yellowstonensis]|uniref:Casein kinase II subunit beta n=1 Tax=Galdieria yellowstonensis TaxID=3028027 RepID=A0AAV9I8M2_9RHOD|nr:hypothetical protein GAYE_SCF00G1636 [Galdieria yellowstonensis]
MPKGPNVSPFHQPTEIARSLEKKMFAAEDFAVSFSNGPRENSLESSEEGSLDSELSKDTSWIMWFCSLKGNEFFCEVDEEFIHDDFNLTGLSTQVAFYEHAVDTILDFDIPEGELDERQQELVEVAAETLYGLIHARFILTSRGLQLMLEKFNRADFGRCPRVLCHGQPVVPVGLSDTPRQNTVKVFCPRCWDIFSPRSRSHCTLDGAYWGTTFAHLFFHTYPDRIPVRNKETYIPRIYGFRLHETSEEVRRNRGEHLNNGANANNA